MSRVFLTHRVPRCWELVFAVSVRVQCVLQPPVITASASVEWHCTIVHESRTIAAMLARPATGISIRSEDLMETLLHRWCRRRFIYFTAVLPFCPPVAFSHRPVRSRAFQFAIRFDSLCESIRIDSFCKKNRPFDSLVVMHFFLLIYCIASAKEADVDKNSYAMHTIKITPNHRHRIDKYLDR